MTNRLSADPAAPLVIQPNWLSTDEGRRRPILSWQRSPAPVGAGLKPALPAGSIRRGAGGRIRAGRGGSPRAAAA